MKNVFIHRIDPNNPGDLNSTPYHYLESWQRGFLVDYTSLQYLSGWDFDNVVIGGGGLTAKFLHALKDFKAQQASIKNLVVWGAGWEVDNTELDDLAKDTTLLGIREWLPGTVYEQNWVPCASVLHPEIQKNLGATPSQNFLVIDHFKRNPIEFEDTPCTRISNRPNTIEEVLKAIADHRFVITSSYHGVYWSLLLNKRVVFVSDPWHAKVATSKYAVPQGEKFSWDLFDQTEKYPNAYEECRQANLAFIEKFKNLTV